MKLDIVHFPQNSYEWHKSRIGVVTASRASEALSKKGTATRQNYINELAAQIATLEIPEINAKQMEWGKLQEPNARAAYEELYECSVETVGFIYGKDRRIGCSPDAKREKELRGVEIKCPYTSKVHVDFLAMDKIKPEYIQQCQFSMWVTGFETWDFCSYDPRFKKHIFKTHTLEKDPEIIQRFENEIPEFIKDLDAVLAKLEIEWGSQWTL